MSNQLFHLNRYLVEEDALSLQERSLHFGQPSTLSDDYRVTLLSLRLQPHLMALLLKFREIFGVEWHNRSVKRQSVL